MRLSLASLALLSISWLSPAFGEGSPQIFSATYSTAFQDIDPSTGSTTDNVILANIYETLTIYRPGQNGAPDTIEPGLATAWEKSDDGKVWTFHLRDGVTFHDGTPLTSGAVKFSVERTKALAGGLSFIWDPVESIDTPDDKTVVFTLSAPAPLDIVAAAGYAAWIVSPAAADKDGAWFNAGNDAGTGPYKIRQYEPGKRIILDRFADYWGETAERPFDIAVIEAVEDYVLREQKLKAGETDWIENVQPDNVDLLAQTPGIMIVENDAFQNFAAHFNTAKPLLANPDVRRALSYAFPYDDFITVMGASAALAHGPLPQSMEGHAVDGARYSLDLEKARALLEKAGVAPDTLSLSFTYTSGLPEGERAAELYKASLAKIGVNLDIQPMLWDAQWSLAKGDPAKAQDIFAMFWWPTYVTPYDFLFSLYHSEDEPYFNLSYYKNPAFDEAIDMAADQLTTDRAASLAAFSKASDLIADEAVSLFLMDQRNVFALRSDVEGYVDNPAYNHVISIKDLQRAAN